MPDAQSEILKRPQRFDRLDSDAFSNQDWKLFDEIHCPDVVVSMPDGHEIHGIAIHREDIASMFESMPDLRVTSRPVSFGTETWTSSTPERRTSADALKPSEWTSTICILPLTRFEQEPRTPFGLVDPILNEARGSDIAKPVEHCVPPEADR